MGEGALLVTPLGSHPHPLWNILTTTTPTPLQSMKGHECTKPLVEMSVKMLHLKLSQETNLL